MTETPDPFSRRSNVVTTGDNRSEGRRDRDRIFYSSEFARLEGVTQVATRLTSGVHNRLTHSYRVEHVAVAIAQQLAAAGTPVDEDAVAAASLAHDIGHAPFGHTGEVALQEILLCKFHAQQPMPTNSLAREPQHLNGSKVQSCSKCYLADGFEGNAQTLRILARLGSKSLEGKRTSDGSDVDMDKVYGLDLTRRTLAASTKYPWLYGGNASKPKKWGAYDGDKDIFDWVFEGGVKAKTLEADIMDTADDIAYAVHDVEDFYKSGLIPLQDLLPGTDEFNLFMEYVGAELDSGTHSDIRNALRDLVADYQSAIERGVSLKNLDEIPEDLGTLKQYAKLAELYFPVGPYVDTPAGREQLIKWRSALLTRFIADLQVAGRAVEYKNGFNKLMVALLHQMTWAYVIDEPQLAAVREGQQRIMRNCFIWLFETAERLWVDPSALWQYLSPGSKARRNIFPRLWAYLELGRKEPGRYSPREVVARAVIDYICSLTDDELYELSAQIDGDALHAVPRALRV